LILLGGFVVLIVVVAATLLRLGRSERLTSVLEMLQDTTAEIRVRFAVVLLVLFVVLASKFGLETILGAFLAGAILNFVDRDSMSHPNFRAKLDAIGYGFLVPVFFVTSGLTFDLRALLHSPSAFAKIPLFLLGLLVVRGVPAVVYRSSVGRRNAIAIGLLQATSLPFLVVASAIGVSLGVIKPVTGTALVSAGLLSCVIFPLVALILLRRTDADTSSSIELPQPTAETISTNSRTGNRFGPPLVAARVAKADASESDFTTGGGSSMARWSRSGVPRTPPRSLKP
jgi:Kef-type K+ transport system membrane component KefB